MKWKGLSAQTGRDLAALIGKYKFVLLVIALGIALLLLPTGGGGSTAARENGGGPAESFDVEAMEQRLAAALEKIDGAGRVTVVLSVKSGTRQILAQDDKSVTRASGESDQTSTTVVVAAGSGQQEAVVLQEIYPQYLGALVVCEGAGDPALRLKMVEAVTALTGLGADKISICKGK